MMFASDPADFYRHCISILLLEFGLFSKVTTLGITALADPHSSLFFQHPADFLQRKFTA